MYSFKCGNDNVYNLKGISKSQSKHLKFEELFRGGKYQEVCEIFLRSVSQEKYLQQLKKSTLSIFVDKRCYIYETESTP